MIVLAFVVLLTGLTVAFFSSSLLYRQISNSSASEAKVDLFAQGAVDTIVGDLKQEIAAGSNASTPAPGVTIYAPRVPLAAVPCPVSTPDPVNTNRGLVNLVKRSAASQPFYANPANGAGVAPYDTANFVPSNRAAGVSSVTPSLNGRSISPARWNKALLLAKKTPTSDTDFTPVGATAASGSTAATWSYAPDWVLVARDGSNPTGGFNNNMVSSASGSSSVIGRYAYTVYNEGGLLDLNVAGCPQLQKNQFGVVVANAPYSTAISYKNALAFVDLTQLPGISALPSTGSASRQGQVINSLVGWRNYASAQLSSGTVAAGNFKFNTGTTPYQPFNFYVNGILANSNGYLQTTTSSSAPTQTDRMFAGRQEMMSLLLRAIATQTGAASTDKANLQNALQYLGTFSREVNQPSLVPATSFANNPKPASAAIGAGGNDASNLGGDTKINPPFLNARVTAAFTRNDGSAAAVGDPLVSKRFALSRLAWLTFKGPIADDSGNLSTDPAIQSMITTLETTYGIPAQFLQQGGPTNIQKYFGLSWVVDSSTSIGIGDSTKKWKYVHGALGGTRGPIQRLDQISGRDPDFIELLKAAVTTGAIAKPAAAQPPANAANTPVGYQAQKDASTDGAIVQLAANIVDQFDLDSYPTRIIFDDGSYTIPQEFRGIEDLPYLYRLRGSLIKVHEASPRQNTSGPGPAAVADPGVGSFVEQPEIWNPHAWNSSVTPPATSSIKPLLFRAVAVSTDPNGVAFSPQSTVVVAYSTSDGFMADVPSSPGEHGPVVLTADNTELDFQIPSNRPDFFREPTLLIKPNVPLGNGGDPNTGSKLTTGANHLIRKDPAVHGYLSTDGSSLKSLYKWNLYTQASPAVADDESYLGFYIASVPLWFPVAGSTYHASTYVSLSNNQNLTYRLQYADPNSSGTSPAYVTYDEKLAPISFTNFDNTGVNEFGDGDADSPVRWVVNTTNYEVFCDPRTARFGTFDYQSQANGSAQFYTGLPATFVEDYRFVNANQNAMWTARPDEYGGWPTGPISFSGFYNTSGDGRFGLFSQNDPSAPAATFRFKGDGQGGTNGPQYYTDPDGVVRRGMGGYIIPTTQPGGNSVATSSVATGLPMTAATTINSAGVGTPNVQAPSRPIILNRPFRTVGDLGYTFSGTPWRNVDFSRPESGYAGLLDAFCVNVSDNATGLVAGKVDLNTHQVPVLQAILAGATKDEFNVTSTSPSLLTGGTTTSEAAVLATALSTRTSGGGPTTGANANNGPVPLTNLADLVGRWTGAPQNASSGGTDGTRSYDGFSLDLGSLSIMANSTPPMNIVTRYREAAARALAATGQARVWNLMIDVVAQTGRYPASAGSLAAFNVEGEQRYWVHLAIDRYTGQVVDKVVEVVKE